MRRIRNHALLVILAGLCLTTWAMQKAIHTAKAPKAIGPYSQAVAAGDWIFTSGAIAIDPATQQMVNGTFEDEVKRVMLNLQAILQEAGCDFSHVVKTTVYLTDLNNFQSFNEIYGSFLKEPYPARSTVQVAALPKGAKIEIEVIARKKS